MNRKISSVSWGYTKVHIFNKVKNKRRLSFEIRIYTKTGFTQYIRFFHSLENTGKYVY